MLVASRHHRLWSIDRRLSGIDIRHDPKDNRRIFTSHSIQDPWDDYPGCIIHCDVSTPWSHICHIQHLGQGVNSKIANPILILVEPVLANIEKCGLDCREVLRVPVKLDEYPRLIQDTISNVLGYFSLLVLLLAIFCLKRIVGVLLDLFFDDILEKHGSPMSHDKENYPAPKHERQKTWAPRSQPESMVEQIAHRLSVRWWHPCPLLDSLSLDNLASSNTSYRLLQGWEVVWLPTSCRRSRTLVRKVYVSTRSLETNQACPTL
jgi:hypothetical protein